jgi:hypothetical protein
MGCDTGCGAITSGGPLAVLSGMERLMSAIVASGAANINNSAAQAAA